MQSAIKINLAIYINVGKRKTLFSALLPVLWKAQRLKKSKCCIYRFNAFWVLRGDIFCMGGGFFGGE